MTKKHDIIWLESLDSTNNEVARRIMSLDNLSVVSAYSQTQGRGQRGNIWISEPGENLTFSVILKYGDDVQGNFPCFPAKNQEVISAITAISIIELLSEYGIDAKIKLPNDIYVSDKKICGILIEHTVKGESLKHSIIGIGLNINQCNFDVNLPNPTSLAVCLKEKGSYCSPISTDDCLNQFLDIYKRNLRLLNEGRDFSKMLESMRALLR